MVENPLLLVGAYLAKRRRNKNRTGNIRPETSRIYRTKRITSHGRRANRVTVRRHRLQPSDPVERTGLSLGRSPFETESQSRSGPRSRAWPMTWSASLTITDSPAVKRSGATPGSASGTNHASDNPSPMPASRSSAPTMGGPVNPSDRAMASWSSWLWW